jgi:hypothetical protein
VGCVGLFYTSNIPITLSSTLCSDIFLINQLLYSRYSGNLLVRLLGVQESRGGSALHASSGVAYYMSPPLNFKSYLIPSTPKSLSYSLHGYILTIIHVGDSDTIYSLAFRLLRSAETPPFCLSGQAHTVPVSVLSYCRSKGNW